MRKTRFILVALLAVVGAIFAFAKYSTVPASNDTGYVQNKATGQFLTSTATLAELGAEITFTNEGEQEHFGSEGVYVEEAGYTYVRFKYSGTSNYLRMGGDAITGSGSGYHKWAVKYTDNGFVIRCIYTPTQGNNALPYAIQGAYLVGKEDGSLALSEELTDAAYWDFVSVEEYEEYVAEIEARLAEEEAARQAELIEKLQSVTPGDDVTFALQNPNFSGSTTGWTVNDGKIELKGSADNNVITAFNYVFDVSQTIENLKPGKYELKVQAFSRPTTNQGSLDLVAAGTELENYCYIYANDEELQVKQLTDEHLDAAGAGTWSEHTVGDATIYLPNNGSAFSDAFTRGMYENTLEVEVGEDGILTIGVKNTQAPTNQGECYCGYDNFRLTFLDYNAADYAEYAKVLDAAQNTFGHYSKTAKNELATALATYGEGYTGDPGVAAANLGKAVEKAQASIVAYKGIEACYESNKQFLEEKQAEIYESALESLLADLEAETVEGDGVEEMKQIVLAAENAKQHEFYEGVKYLYNVQSGKYWGAGNDWGTRASLVEHPTYVKLALLDDGTYTLESQASNGGTQYYFNGDYMDNGSPVHLTFKKAEGGVTIANGNTGYGYDGTSTILGKGVTGDAALWQVLSEQDMLDKLATATEDEPQDATFLILDPGFDRNNRNAGAWTFEASNKNISGGNNNNNCAESYHAVFTLSQTLNDVPNGVYALTAQAFYRQDGTDEENLPYFFINDEKTTFPVKTGSENSMSNASESFTNGMYTIAPMVVEVTDGKITLGAKNDVNTNLWCIWDNFVLTYYGADASAAAIAAKAKAQGYILALNAAQAIDQTAAMPAAILAQLQTALSNYAAVLEGEYTAETLATATEALKAATEAANNGIKNAAAIAAMKALTENTNVYTAEAFDKFQEYFDKYDAGELTEVLVNPDNVQGWHAANIYDDFLLSAWTIGGTQCADFNTSLYINTWSTEADGKENGSGLHVPFFEYWTGDANSLGANTLEATVTDLPAGTYEVSALVRVRIKNDNTDPAHGITLSVNDGEAVDVCAGEACDDGAQFVYGTFTAVGEVGEDGVLKIDFNVAEDNNISWLSYKNVYYTKVGGEEIANMRYEDLTAEDFFSWTAADATGEKKENVGCAYVLNESTGMPYGDGNVYYLNYADLSDAAELVIVATEGTPRTLFNRVTDGGNVGVEEPRDAEAYWTVVDNGDGSKTYTVDIAKIVAEYGFAHLHSIKGANWQNTTVTSMKIGYSLDAPEKKVPEGWKTLIANGNFAGEDASNFYTKGTGHNDPVVATIEAGIGVDGGHAVKVEAAAGAADDWTFQFFIKGNENLPAGKKVHVEFDYRADVAAGSDTQWHKGNPGDYKHYAAIGSPNFTTEWQHFEYEGAVQNEADGSNIIAFNISKYRDADNTYYFDNIVFWVEDPKAVEIDNFDKLMIAQVAEANVVVPVGSGYNTKQDVDVDFTSILKTLGIESITDAKVYAVQSDGSLVDNLGAKNTDGGGGTDGWRNADGDFAGWGDVASQFYVKADFTAESGQLWEIGGHPDHTGAHLTEATTYTAKYAFVVGETSIDNKAAVLNVNVIYDNGEDAPEAEVPAGWRSIITNGNLAGDDVSSFYTKGIGYNDPVVATIYDGAGVNGSRGLKIEEGAKEPDDWTTQFFINGSEALPAGTKIHVEFDYRATAAAQSGTQFHTAPGTYKHYAAIGNQDFTTEWKHFVYEGTVESGADGSAAIAFNLSINKDPKTYYFDNIVFWVEDAGPAELAVVETKYDVQYGQEYTPGENLEGVTIDVATVLEKLGVASLDEVTVYAVQSDGTLDPNFTLGSTDGWRNAVGDWTTWSTADNMVCVKLDEQLNITYLGGLNLRNKMATDDDLALTATYKAVKTGDEEGSWVTIKVTLNVAHGDEVPASLTDLAQLHKQATFPLDINFQIGDTYNNNEAKSTVDLPGILAMLEATSLDEVTIYAVQSNGTLDKDYKLGTTDGWRDANGDWAAWGNTASQFYVKADFSLESEQIYATSAHPDHSGAHLTEATTYTATFAFVKGETAEDNKAVILKVNLLFGGGAEVKDATAINGINAGQKVEGIFNAQGQKLNELQKGLNIVNGKKVYVK